jgi:hypothetical protein
VADRGEGRDRDAHSIVIKSLARQRAPLESAITATLNARDPLATGWFWAVPYPPSLHNLLQALEKDARFGVCTATREAAAKPGGSEGLPGSLQVLSWFDMTHSQSPQSLLKQTFSEHVFVAFFCTRFESVCTCARGSSNCTLTRHSRCPQRR